MCVQNSAGNVGHPSIMPRRGLPGMRSKLAGNTPLTVAFLGGSITEGAGASDASAASWRARTGAYLQRLYAGHPVRCINAGVGGTTSIFGAHRLQEHVLREGPVDLLFIEFSVNDGEDRGESIRGMEGIVRQCRRLSPETELVFVYMAADKNLTGYKPFNIAVHEEVAEYYGIPSIDCAAMVYTMIRTGELDWKRFAPDGYHPLDDGHALYAAFVQEYVQQEIACGGSQAEGKGAAGAATGAKGKEATEMPGTSMEKEASEVRAAGESQDNAATRAAVLPVPPLDPRSYEYARMLDYSTAEYSAAFRVQELQPGEPLMNWRFATAHACTEDPQAEFTFTVTGQGAGLVLLYGPDSGILEYSLNGGPYTEINLFDDWCPGAYRPVLALFPVQTERGVLQIAVRNTGRRDSRSTGNGLRVLGLLCN
ncbi:SGNH/GDSL hydrolase family protein [Paenibacillus tritici]|uniref:SGNH/GDSL hydrolase family protein n=1 Tax=Paenibacillus tritici TaxID=1873425 RepID=UPI001BAD7523|nr:SGNH/GDSL hydrolase family protein [Paenibacillus tritici]QUL56475.1 SGNH/GDSL hydrolase family protein [Paenibacillus tritici]